MSDTLEAREAARHLLSLHGPDAMRRLGASRNRAIADGDPAEADRLEKILAQVEELIVDAPRHRPADLRERRGYRS